MLNDLTWPTDQLELALYGDKSVVDLCKLLNFSSDKSVDILADFTLFKKNKKMGKNLKSLYLTLQTYPLSSAACERGFSQMNLCHTDIRNRLVTETISNLLMISINGPPIELWEPKKYVISWLQNGSRGALAKATGIKKKEVVLSHSAKLFL